STSRTSVSHVPPITALSPPSLHDALPIFDERLGRGCGAGGVGAFAQATIVDVVLDLRHREVEAEAFGGLVTEAEDLGEVVAGIDVEESEGDLRRPEGLRRQVEHGHGVLAAGE